MEGIAYVDGGVLAPQGFLAAGVSAGLKRSGKRDVAVIAAQDRCPTAAVFTRNAMAAAPVLVSREHVADGHARAVVVNAGNANACTGERGRADAQAMAEAAAAALGCGPQDVLVASTGVIGVPLPVDLVIAGIKEAVERLDVIGGDAVAEAIMTTDTFPKQVAVRIEVDGRAYAVGGVAKGSGMIRPDMATMLAFITTDAPLDPRACDAALRQAVEVTFNRVTVDSDTSTNDTCVLMASGAAGGAAITPDDARFAPVAVAIEYVCGELARMIARDGEGATKLITVTVTGARDESDAKRAAFAIAESPLVKTAVFGGDANWGRVAMAIGKSGAALDPSRVRIVFAGVLTCENGTAVPFSEEEAARALSGPEVEIVADLGAGEASATVWTCDLTYEYVRINGEYRS
ncbi:bifunctional glutamate N-acetyltransferase/amino-acid acetyltransferase ArgJ [Coriobacteriia bacterium Es71-Z0120]|nr:bifunctional glutamate N-acetyltransferase/amino-acid acetyltransferase ArgJ [Parvivirga hydrogeniphila]